MFASFRFAVVGLLIAALAAAYSLSAFGHGGGGGGHGGSGGGGGHMGGSSMGGGSAGHSWQGGGATSGHAYSPSQGSHPGSSAYSHGANSAAWNHNANNAAWGHNNWGDHHGWDYNHAWWHDHGYNWVGWWGIGSGWPWYDAGWWPGYYGYFYAIPYPYCADLYADYGYAPTVYTAAYPPGDNNAAPSPGETATALPPPPAAGGDDPMGFYTQAVTAFQEGDYRNATRLAGHAAIDDPRNPNVHLLLSLGMFALGEYRGAAMEAHAVAVLGKVPDWATLFSFYGKVEPYTDHLRALEKYVHEKPSAPEGAFLLGFQYTMAGHREEAQKKFLQALKLTPKDRLAAQLLTQVGGSVPAEIAEQLKKTSVPTAPAVVPPPAPSNPSLP